MDQDTLLEAGFSRITNVARDLRVGDTFDTTFADDAAVCQLVGAKVLLVQLMPEGDAVNVYLRPPRASNGVNLILLLDHPVLITDQIPYEVFKQRQRAQQGWHGLLTMLDD